MLLWDVWISRKCQASPPDQWSVIREEPAKGVYQKRYLHFNLSFLPCCHVAHTFALLAWDTHSLSPNSEQMDLPKACTIEPPNCEPKQSIPLLDLSYPKSWTWTHLIPANILRITYSDCTPHIDALTTQKRQVKQFIPEYYLRSSYDQRWVWGLCSQCLWKSGKTYDWL